MSMYDHIDILGERKTMRYADARDKVKRVLFALSLYPNMSLARDFVQEKDIHKFLDYWIGKESHAEIRKHMSERVEVKEHELLEILEYLYQFKSVGLDYIKVLDMLLHGEVRKEEEKNEYDEIGEDEEFELERIMAALEAYMVVCSKKINPDLKDGRYLVLLFRQILIGTNMTPFVLVAKELENGKYRFPRGYTSPAHLIDFARKALPMPYSLENGEKMYMTVKWIEGTAGRGGRDIYSYPHIEFE